MKHTFLFLLLALALPGLAQEYKQRITADQLIKIQYHKAELRIEAHKGNELIIQARDYEAPPERAKGLRPLYNTAVDNTNTGMSVESKDGQVLIREAMANPGQYLIRVPENARLSIEQMNWGGNNIEVIGMRNELEVKSKTAEVRLMDVSGPVIVNSTSGDITIRFSELSQKGPSMISSVASEIDISLPASAKAELHLSSVVGEIYTDLDLKVQNKDGKEASLTYLGGGQSTIKASLNGGGSTLTVRSTSSNIYLRKR
ncbi:DUF4097 family beta strand repeat-containing protein [Cesiribacter andamanensis]|nr:DUF4097 family beta strand repeat-containing protein [Cesiribacter andamanensis]